MGETPYIAAGKEIKIRALAVREFPQMLAALTEGEPRLVELFTGLSADEVDALPIDDFEKILALGSEINLPPFSRWGKRQKAAAKLLDAAFTEAPTATLGASGANT